MSAVTTHPVPSNGNTPPESPLPELPAEQIVYSVPHAATIVDVSPRKMWHLVRTEQVKSFLLGGNRRIHRDDLEEYVNSQREAA